MKRAFAVWVVTLFAAGCGGDAGGSAAKSPDDAVTPPADAPADAAPADKPADAPAAADKPAAAKAAGDADEGAWAGEAEAKNTKAPEGGGQAETRTTEVIAQVVKDNRKPVRDCFDKAKKDLPDLHGDVVIHFVLDPDGKVKKADLDLEKSTLKSAAVSDCAIKVLQAVKFPPSSRGKDTTVNYPFNFKP